MLQVLNSDKDESVRLAALNAFARVGSFDFHDALFRLTKPGEEPDASVREKAWEVFKQLLPTATKDQLRDYAELFRRSEEMSRRLPILLEQARRDQNEAVREQASPEQKQAALADLAAQRENIGAAYFQLHQPEQAVPYFRQALDYWLANNARGVEAENLIRELMLALLDSKQYAEAAKFADATIARNPDQQRIVAPLLVNRADDLLDPPPLPGQPRPPASPRDALQLATEGLKMNPGALRKDYRSRLEAVITHATQRLNGAGSRPSP